MTDSTSTLEQLANDIAARLEGAPLDVAASALVLNLACVVTAYGPATRDTACDQFTALLHTRIKQLTDAGEFTTQDQEATHGTQTH